MDVWATHLKTASPALSAAMWAPLTTGGAHLVVMGKRSRRRSLVMVVAAAGSKKPPSSGNSDSFASKGEGSEDKSQNSSSDWRDFRASLIAREQEQLVDPDALIKTTPSNESAHRLGLKWAHPISVLETGCILVATEKLDAEETFSRTVILLLRLGSREAGTLGVILNRPLNKKIQQDMHIHTSVPPSFGDCSVNFGGPLDNQKLMNFLMKMDDEMPVKGFRKIINGIYFGDEKSLVEADALLKRGVIRPQDVKFFAGYAGWHYDQLLNEIELGWWVTAACSANLIVGAASSDSSELWTETLQLMGGKYAKLSQKPQQESS